MTRSDLVVLRWVTPLLALGIAAGVGWWTYIDHGPREGVGAFLAVVLVFILGLGFAASDLALDQARGNPVRPPDRPPWD